MKKFIIILAALLIATSLVACTDKDDDKDTGSSIDIPTEDTSSEDPSTDGTEDPTEDDTTPAGDREFTETNDKVYIFASTGAANLRTDTSYADSAKAVSLNNNTELERIGVDGSWSKVKYEDKEYYISNNVIIEKTLLDGFEAVEKTVKIKVATLNVRFAPGTRSDSDIIGDVKKDQVIEVVGYNKNIGEAGWYKIKVEANENFPDVEYGYISAHSDYSDEVTAPIENNTENSTEAAS